MAKAKKTKEEVVETTSDVEAPETTVTPVQLTLQDMQAVSNVIDLASRRGAFQASEMETVGAVYNKLNSFLTYIASTADDKDTTEDGSTAQTEVETETGSE